MLADDSGDGFVTLVDGTRRWGRFGAAGILLRHSDERGRHTYFVARRAAQIHGGGTWGVPGGALHRGEAPFDAATREFREEIGYELGAGGSYSDVAEVYEDDHGGWSYWTFLMDVQQRNEGREQLNWETDEIRWVTASELAQLDLFGAFRSTLHHLGVLPDPG